MNSDSMNTGVGDSTRECASVNVRIMGFLRAA